MKNAKFWFSRQPYFVSPPPEVEERRNPSVKAARTKDILLESLEEHLSLKRLMADLLALGPSEQTFEPKFKVFKEQAEHHHKEEEEHLFPKVKALLDEDHLQQLGAEMIALQTQQKMEGRPRDNVSSQTDAATPLWEPLPFRAA